MGEGIADRGGKRRRTPRPTHGERQRCRDEDDEAEGEEEEDDDEEERRKTMES